jgi:FkbM family methyltransferase
MLRGLGYTGRIESFEPGEQAYRRLARATESDPLWEAHQLALCAESGTAELHLTANNGESSSLLPISDAHIEAAPHAAPSGSEIVKTRRLDDILTNARRPTLLKIDVQGGELLVLEGAPHLLEGDVALIETEVSLRQFYVGQPLAPEVVDYLREREFVLRSLEPDWRDSQTAEVHQFNAFFTRRG